MRFLLGARLIDAGIIIIVLLWIVVRQQQRRPFRVQSGWIVPALLAILTWDALRPMWPHLSAIDALSWGVSAAVGCLIAWLRFRWTHVQWVQGQLYVQGTPWGTVFWFMLLGAKLLGLPLLVKAHALQANLLSSDFLIMAAASTIGRRLLIVAQSAHK
jgi:hypothetical protein